MTFRCGRLRTWRWSSASLTAAIHVLVPLRFKNGTVMAHFFGGYCFRTQGLPPPASSSVAARFPANLISETREYLSLEFFDLIAILVSHIHSPDLSCWQDLLSYTHLQRYPRLCLTWTRTRIPNMALKNKRSATGHHLLLPSSRSGSTLDLASQPPPAASLLTWTFGRGSVVCFARVRFQLGILTRRPIE